MIKNSNPMYKHISTRIYYVIRSQILQPRNSPSVYL
jgi:hypothetical protein